MTNNVIFTEGFDKYGPAAASQTVGLNAIASSQLANAMKGIWTQAGNNAGSQFIGPPLVAAGTGSYCIVGGANNAASILATLPGGNYAKAVGGVYIKISTQRTSNGDPIQIRFLDAGTMQAGIGTPTNGSANIQVFNASLAAIATSSATYTPGTPFLLEWDIQMLASGNYTVWKDGTSIISGSGGNFHGSANNFYNQIKLSCAGSASQANHDISYDHLYVNDGTSTALLAQTVIETDFPTADSAVQFAPGGFGLGFQNALGTSQTAPGANTLYLRKVTAPVGGATLNSVTIVPAATSAGANFKAVLYADSAGAPAALIATGTQVTGTTSGATLTLPFSAGQALTASTSYWIGYITDTSVTVYQSDTGTTGWEKTNTYASGAPNPAGTATSTTFANLILWGNCTATTTNWIETSGQVPYGAWGDFSYVFDSTVGHEDLFSIGALSVTPNTIYTVGVYAFLKDSAAGARTVTINLKSGGTDSAGSGFTPGNTNYGWSFNYYATDPNTASAWGASGLNAATSGYKITA